MSIVELKKQLHDTIESIGDKRLLEAVLTILASKSLTANSDWEEKQFEVLKEREANYTNGQTSATSLEEFKQKMKHKYGL